MAKAPGRLMRLVNNREQIFASIMAFTRPRATRMWEVARVEMAPPLSGSEIAAAKKGAQQVWNSMWTCKWKNLTVREASINAAVTAEIMMWFFFGEIIGKGSIIGYNIPGATHFPGMFEF